MFSQDFNHIVSWFAQCLLPNARQRVNAGYGIAGLGAVASVAVNPVLGDMCET